MHPRLAFLPSILLSFAPALMLFASNAGVSEARELLAPGLIGGAVAGGAFLLALAAMRDSRRAGIAAFATMVAFFLAGQISYALTGRRLPLGDDGVPASLLGPVLVLPLLVFVLRRRPADPARWLRLMLIFAVISVALPGSRVVTSLLQSPPSDEVVGPRAEDDSLPALAAIPDRPHVFHFLLDGYGRADVLRDLYDYDDSPFLDALRERGFFVAERARTNYAQTALSLASTLNMTYLGGMPATARSEKDRLPLKEMINDGRVLRVFRAAGYETVAFATGYELAELRGADRFLSHQRHSLYQRSEFFRAYVAITPLRQVRSLSRRAVDRYGTHRNHVRYALRQLPKLAAERKPLYVFAHLITPHPPFIFDEDGDRPSPKRPFSFIDGEHYRRRTKATPEEYRRDYARQIAWVSRQMIETIDRVLESSRRPVAIVLHGDHGPASELYWSSAERSHLDERIGIVSAFLFPDRDYGALHPSITPVNSFRVLFSKLFGADLPPLEDLSYFTGWESPWEHELLEEDEHGRLRLARTQDEGVSASR